MEHNTLQRRSAGTIKNMGVNSYSQIVSAFRAQGDLTEDQLTLLPVLQNALGISRERHTAEVKRALYDEQLSEIALSVNPSSNTTNWEAEANYACSTIVHRPPSTKHVQMAEQLLQTTPPTTVIQHSPSITTTTKLNRDLQKLLKEEAREDGIINATQQQFSQAIKPNLNNFNPTDIQGAKVVRLVRAKQATKRKTSLDTLIEVVQKELLRANTQTNSISPFSSPPHYSQTHSFPSSTKLHNRAIQSNSSPHRSMISSILPSSHPGSLTSQSNQSFKLARKRGLINLSHSKRTSSSQQQQQHQRNQSFNLHHQDDLMDHDRWDSTTDDGQSGPENVEEIVRDVVDKLVAITLLNTAPFVVNMLTAIPGNGNHSNTDSQLLNRSQSINSKFDHYRNDLNLSSSSSTTITSDLRTSIQQASPLKQQQQQQQIHHPQLIIQPATTNPISTTPTLFVAPRILNFQTVVPKPTTNIQIGNTKIILVSPSNINKHLPNSTTPGSTTATMTSHQSNLVNNGAVKLVKFTANNSNPTPIPVRPAASTLTLPKNVQIVVPSHSSSTIPSVRTPIDDSKKSLPINTTNTFRPITTVPVTLTTCTVDQIPQAAQEVTISTSPPLQATATDVPNQPSSSSSLGKSSSRRSSSSTPTDKPVGKVLRPIAKVLPGYSSYNTSIVDNTNPSSTNVVQQSVSTLTRTSPSQDELMKSMTVNFQQQSQQLPRSSSTHGPMIYRMTSVNPNVPVFRVRATTAPTSSTVMTKSIKTDAKPISVTTATNVCYESKPTHTTTTPSGSVSVLACFKTTKKRNKERAIMPRPSINDPNESSTTNNNLSSTSNPNTSFTLSNDILDNNNTSPDYHRQSSSTPTNFVQQTSLSSTLSDDNISNMFPLSMQEQTNDTTTSSSNSIPTARDHNQTNELIENTPNLSPIQSAQSISRPIMEDKSIQCINNEEQQENSRQQDQIDSEQMTSNSEGKKRSADDNDEEEEEDWTITSNDLLRDVLTQSNFDLLDADSQQNLSEIFQQIQTNLTNGVFSSKEDFYKSMLDLKQKLIEDDVFKSHADHLEQLFHYFQTEFSKLNEYKRIRRQ